MDLSVDILLDEDLRLALKARFAPEAAEHLQLKVVSEGSEGIVYVELQPTSARLKGRPIPDAVLALSGVVPGAGDTELGYRRHLGRKHG